MDDAKFYKELAALDQAIADRWKKVTGGTLKLKKKLDIKDLTEILGPVFDSSKITADQAKAINFFHIWTFKSYTQRTTLALYKKIEDAYTLDYFFTGSSAQLASPTQLKEFNGAIGASAGKMDFSSPGTGHTYQPDQFEGIKQMVADGMITVFEVDAAWLHAKSGLYRTDKDRLVLYKGVPTSQRPTTILHEIAHAIQDWHNLVTTHTYTEADAYIVGAVTALAVSEEAYTQIQEYEAQLPAARLVLEKKAVLGNQQWQLAYEAVWKAVRKDSTYEKVKDKPFHHPEHEKGKDEKIFADLLRKMKPAAP